MDNIKEKVEKIINEMGERELEPNDIDMLGKLVDIHKDLKNEEYWEVKKMRYGNYRRDYDYDDMSYGRGRRRDSRGRYKGDDMLDEMRDHYDRYSENRRYGGRESGEALEYMLESIVCFVEMLEEDASEQDIELIRKYTRKIANM